MSILTHHELIAAVEHRANQLIKNEKPKVKIPVDIGQGVYSWDPVDIALREIVEKKVGVEIKRQVPGGHKIINTLDVIIPPL